MLVTGIAQPAHQGTALALLYQREGHCRSPTLNPNTNSQYVEVNTDYSTEDILCDNYIDTRRRRSAHPAIPWPSPCTAIRPATYRRLIVSQSTHPARRHSRCLHPRSCCALWHPRHIPPRGLHSCPARHALQGPLRASIWMIDSVSHMMTHDLGHQ